MTTERATTAAIRRTLAKLPNTFSFKLHGHVMQLAGLPDLVVVRKGRVAFFEVKRTGKHPTRLQLEIIRKLREASAVAAIVVNTGEILKIMLAAGMMTPEEYDALKAGLRYAN